MHSNEQIFTAALKLAEQTGVPFYFSSLVTNEQEFKEHVRFHDGVSDWNIPDWEQEQPYTWQDIEDILDGVKDQLQESKCKEEARKLLAETDWAATVDVQNALQNPIDWLTYREEVRRLFINPVVNPSFPAKPDVRWNI
jgi:hypothetical protein